MRHINDPSSAAAGRGDGNPSARAGFDECIDRVWSFKCPDKRICVYRAIAVHDAVKHVRRQNGIANAYRQAVERNSHAIAKRNRIARQ